jgi:hypothetical protein
MPLIQPFKTIGMTLPARRPHFYSKWNDSKDKEPKVRQEFGSYDASFYFCRHI